jgi:hypothetical protein
LKAEVVVLVIKEPKELKDQLVNRDLLVKLDHQEIRENLEILVILEH